MRTLLTQFLGFRFLDFGDFRFRPHGAGAATTPSNSPLHRGRMASRCIWVAIARPLGRGRRRGAVASRCFLALGSPPV